MANRGGFRRRENTGSWLFLQAISYDRLKLEHRRVTLGEHSVGAATKFLWVALVLGATCASAQQKQMRIQFAEPVTLKATAGHSEFDAYGRRFSVELQRNERLVQGLPAAARSQLNHVQLLRGKLEGVSGSWVRLTQVGAGLEGAIWDGQDLYVVTTLARISKNLTTPIDAAPDQSVVYRLSDTLDSLPEAFCGLDERIDAASSRGVSGLNQYRSLVAQIATAAATAPAEQLNLALIADTAFQQQSGNPADEMLARLNIVDGIFTEQIGVLLQPTEFRLVPSSSDPFTATDASQLLDQLSTFRQNTPSVRTAGLAHLFTGKDLNANTIGIAYRDALCDSSFGVSLSDNELGPFYSALVMAHELGHNFGAEHDGKPGGACEATDSGGYLMSPQFNGASVFSACSRNSIAQSVAQARGICIVPAHFADLTASAPATLDAVANSVFTLPVTVRSIGNAAAVDATIKLSLAATLSFQGAVLPDGACSTAGAEVTCHLGDIPANSERVVELKLMSSQISSTSVVATVGAANDYLTANSTTQTYLRFTSAVDLKLAMTVSPKSLYANDTIDITLDVTSMRTQTAHGGQVHVSLFDLEYDSATAGAHVCASTGPNFIRCDLADIPAGQTTRIVLHAHGEHRGDRSVSASVQIPEDGDYSNNYAQDTVRIISENDFLISASTDSLSFETGTMQQVVYTLRAIGRNPSVGSQLRVWAPWTGRLDAVVASAGACTFQGTNTLGLCEFGDLNPGDIRTVTVTFHTTSNGAATLQGEALYHIDPHLVWINNAVTQVYSNLPIDVVASTLYASSVEGQPGSTFAGMESVGLQPAQNVVATLEVPAAVRLTAMSVTNANNWTCTLLTPQRGRCTGAFAATGGASITYAFVSDVPGNHTTKLTVSADGDGNAANNTSEAILTIEPYLDAGITTSATQMQLVAGQDHVVGFTVNTGARPVPGVIAVASRESGFEIASITAAGYSCKIDVTYERYGRCEFGDLPANASVPVSVTYRGFSDNIRGEAWISVFTSVDRNTANNSVRIQYDTVAFTDVQLQIAQTTATAVNGALLNFPRITVTTVGTYAARIPVLQIPLPAFTTVRYVSGSSISCTGTSTLRCEIYSGQAGESHSIDIVLETNGTGTFTSNVTLQSGNDSTAGNNSGTVQLSVTAPPPPPPPPGGGGSSSGGGASKGGGGGRFEWLALAFLGLLAVNRARRPLPIARLNPVRLTLRENAGAQPGVRTRAAARMDRAIRHLRRRHYLREAGPEVRVAPGQARAAAPRKSNCRSPH